ncbi:IVa2 [Psittacine adenovirus 5]|uniref:IVa2 n=1 Tax=Psittacine adenovirus 5 TaxID=2499624 RepID=A0A5J6DDB6_9ADEN|nr:IVa2 [Psittacine adenovirus 5]QER78596.1 IVa2 [Psittacine adenovirus 5]
MICTTPILDLALFYYYRNSITPTNEVEEFYNTVKSWKNAVDYINSGILPDCQLPPYKTFEQYENIDLRTNMRRYNEIQSVNNQYLVNDQLPSINMGYYPFVSLVIGPTGSGKSQLLRNLIGLKKLQPMPEAVIFITPTKGTISHDEIILWKTQLQEGNYTSHHHSIVPTTKVFNIEFIECAFDDVITPENLDVNNENSIFSIWSKKGPVCVILDECMQKLIQKTNISPLYCSLPSKLCSKYGNPFYMFVVLHNVNPVSGHGGNIMDLKGQAKIHILSTKNQPLQLSHFVNNRTGGLNPGIKTILMNSIVSEKNQKYSFVMYNTCPVRESFQWSAILEGGRNIYPLCLDLQNLLLDSVCRVCNVHMCKIKNKTRYQREKKRKLQEE